MIETLTNPTVIVAILAAVAVMATVITLALPLFATDKLSRRMKTVAIEREKKSA